MSTNIYRYHVPTPFHPADPETARQRARNGCRYELITNAATHVHSRQRLCVYRGVEGPDAGEYFVASLSDFAMKFVPDVEPMATAAVPTPESLPVTGEATPERIAGHKSESLGV